MPYGYLVSTVLLTLGTLAALVPPPYRRPVVGPVGFVLGLVVNELPFLALTWLAASTVLVFAQGDVGSAGSWAAVGLAVLTAAGLAVVARRARTAPGIVRAAVADALGPAAAGPVARRTPWPSILLRPLWVHRRDVARTRNLPYGDPGRRHLLDVYRPRAARSPAPVVVYFHGGGYFSGHKNREGRLMLYRLAARGFVCVSANYRLRPHAGFADHYADVERVLAWVDANIAGHGGDPSRVIVAGSSAGAHLAAIAALSSNPPAELSADDGRDHTVAGETGPGRGGPGAAEAGSAKVSSAQPHTAGTGTRVLAAVCLYGYYGYYYGMSPSDRPVSSPLGHPAEGAPPVFVAHGDRDTLVSVDGAREFVEHLQTASPSPVVYAELPGAQHAFDLYRSVRHEAVVDGVEAFVSWVVADAEEPAAQRGTTSPAWPA